MFDDILKLKIPFKVAEYKEKIGLENLFKYLRTYKLYTSRFSYYFNDENLTSRIAFLTFFTGYCALYYDAVKKKVFALEITEKTIDANGNLNFITGKGVNSKYVKKNLEVGKDVVVLQADSTGLPPFIYCIKLNEIINKKEDIIDQQDNMLRKPILISGQGEDFDNMANTLKHVLSGVEFINTKKKKKDDNIMENLGMEVLNLQLNNAYKGKELWESRNKYESLILDYLGYPSVNGDKKERMIKPEVNSSAGIAKASYNEAVDFRKKAIKQFNKLFNVKLKMTENISWEKEEESNGSPKNDMAKNDRESQNNDK